MVRLFESEELRKQARAHEDLCAQQGLAGRCGCLLGAALIAVGLRVPLFSLDRIFGRGLTASASQVQGEAAWQPPTPLSEDFVDRGRGTYEPTGVADYGHGARATLSRVNAGVSYTGAFADDPGIGVTSSDGGFRSQPQSKRHLGLDSSLVTIVISLVAICVLPTLLSRCADPRPPPPPSWGAADARVDAYMAHSTEQLSQRPWCAQGSGAGAYQAPDLAGNNGFLTWFHSFLDSSLTDWTIGWLRSPLPSEAEVAETYAAAQELPRWSAALGAFVSQQIVQPLLWELSTSDQRLAEGFQQMGWRLTLDAPRTSYAWRMMSQEVNIFDANLPQPFCQNAAAARAWEQRQRLETYLQHPSFDRLAQRGYVLSRLGEWRNQGLLNGMQRYGRSEGGASMPTDAHILEHLVLQMVQESLPEFRACFIALLGHPAPTSLHLGQASQAWLRQVTNQNVWYWKRPPHYEVVTPLRTWKLRPGNRNILEALALLLHVLRTSRSSRSYYSFPVGLRAALERASTL
mmetsp:Transcript_70976/g.197174  ORF Transcript_70976/g.197174 Transcript_70976/m.197174 type:complete len:517 (-) Transcript_70976:65-1615(-)